MITEPERVAIRAYMGWPPGHTEPRYDSQIDRIQMIGDGQGGIIPTQDTENEVRRLLGLLAYPVVGTAPPNGLMSIESALTMQWQVAMMGSADEARIDPARGRVMLCAEGRRLIFRMATILDASPLVDAFGATVTTPFSQMYRDRSPNPHGAT